MKERYPMEQADSHITLLPYANVCYGISPTLGSGYKIEKGGQKVNKHRLPITLLSYCLHIILPHMKTGASVRATFA